MNNACYITTGTQDAVPYALQLMLWRMAEDASLYTDLDRLQIFELRAVTVEDVPTQEVIHFQEQPEYHGTLTFPFETPITETLCIINKGKISAMLLSSEK